jgi:hypothetical protein
VQAMRTQLIDPITSEVDNSFGLLRIDAGLQYQVRPGFTWTARYELMLQTSGRDAMDQYVAGFFRNTLFFSFKIRWPEDVVVSVPKRRQNAVRSDRKDLMPLGSEPVIPDLQEGGGDDDRR